MGQKVNPIGLRLGICKTWDSKWFSGKNYSALLHEDLRLKRYLKGKLYHAGLSKVEIERAASKTTVNIYTARPGMVIGRGGAGIEGLKKELQAFTSSEVFVNIREVRKAEMDGQLVAENIAMQLERRVAFRRAMKKSIQAALKMGAKGMKVICSGRLGGAEIARSERYMEGRVPLHTLRANIDYGFAESKTTYGLIGVKVWVYKGDYVEERDVHKAN